MNVKVEVELCGSPGEKDKEQMYVAAENLTNDIKSIVVSESKRKDNVLVAEFTIDKAKQIDVVDEIGDEFSDIMENYDDSSIDFPKRRTAIRKKSKSEISKPAKKYTPKQGQYLAFIYYYTKLNGCSPAEYDMQKYFQTTPPTVHNMIVQLDKKGFIERTPRQARSIKLLLSRDELPDLK